jgi:hypothetical protein
MIEKNVNICIMLELGCGGKLSFSGKKEYLDTSQRKHIRTF